jgi:predicted transposase YbfD/YdcC
VAAYFAVPDILCDFTRTETADAVHGRIEARGAFVSPDLSSLRGTKRACSEPVRCLTWPCLGMMEAIVTRHGKTTTTHYYHLSSRSMSASEYLAAARAHWSIKNGLAKCSA